MKEQFNLSGKVALVTGASKGIGEAMAHALAEFGAKVVVSSRSQEAVEKVAEKIQAEGNEAFALACNIGEEQQLQELVNRTVEQYGGVDILINNAATNPAFGPLLETEGAIYDKIMNVNVKASFLLSNLCFPIMKGRGGGSVINISSVEGMRPSAGLGIYSVSKAALIMLTKTQAKEWGPAGIRSNVICPGLVQTKFSAALWQNEKLLESLTKQLPLGRMAQPEEMIGLAVFLASQASSYCTGSVFTSDGGYMIAG